MTRTPRRLSAAYVLALAAALGLGVWMLGAIVGNAVDAGRRMDPTTEPTVAGTVVTRP